MIEAELIARTILLSTVRPDVKTEVWAYRTLAAGNPGYHGRLADALVRLERVTPELPTRLRLSAEAVATARRIDPDQDHHATDLLVWALDAYQRNLHDAGRVAEGLAARQEIIDRYRPDLHSAKRCGLQECYAGKVPPPIAEWIAATPPLA